MLAMGPYAGKESQTERWMTERVFFDGPDFPVVLPLVVEPEGADDRHTNLQIINLPFKKDT